MCGIFGFLAHNPIDGDDSVYENAVNALAHRGPDRSGIWMDRDAGVFLGHRRLSILDLSPAGDQPMVSASGRYVIIYNGEIYNHLALRATLEKHGQAPAWRGHSDTETLLAGFEAWGIESTLQQATGMFAFAVWDRTTGRLTLARDRLGEKPLYYGWQGNTFLFGSELKALQAHPAFEAAIDRDALAMLMRFNTIPAPHAIYRGIHKLLPGTTLTVSAQAPDAPPCPYWQARQVVEQGLADPFRGSPQEAIEALEALLKDAIAQQMIADVPLGAFLSGGVDSSTVVALMQAQSSRPVKTFTIGFHEARYNEANYAKAVANHLGTDHTELYVTPQEVMAVIPRLPGLYSEPFSDSSQLPTFLIAQLARQQVTVSLSGDGGDEVFGGYNRYVLSQRWWGKLRMLPVPVRQEMARAIMAVSPERWNALLTPVLKRLPARLNATHVGHKLHKSAGVLASRTSLDLYQGFVTHWAQPDRLVLGASEPPSPLFDPASQPAHARFIEQMMALDLVSYLPDDILCKVDRAAMGVSLETRVPYLDHRVVAFAWRLPLEMKIRDGVGKWILRQVLCRHVPRELLERPKMGFEPPIEVWLRGPLRDWAESLLDETRLRQEGYFDPAPIRHKWAEHLSGKRNWHFHLWDVLMFQAWLEAQH